MGANQWAQMQLRVFMFLAFYLIHFNIFLAENELFSTK